MNEKTKNGENKQGFHWDLRTLRLPKSVEADPRRQELLRILTDHARILWPEGKLRVPMVAFSPALAEALRTAHRAGQLVRSLEGAERRLAAEDRGLGLVDQQSGVLRGARVSRLLVLADDGTERFYRQVEKLLRRQGPRVLALRLNVKAETLGPMLFGPARRAALLLLDHKEAVSAVLLALVESPDGSSSESGLAGGKGQRGTEKSVYSEGEPMHDLRDTIQAISFDAYGTLLCLDRPFERLAEELRRIGLDVPMDVATKVFLQEMLYYRDHHLEGNNPDNLMKLRLRCADALFRMLEQEGFAVEVSRQQRLKVLMGSIHFKLYEDALPALDWCLSQGLATGVISNWDCSLPVTLKQLCPREFTCVVVSACEGVEKSDSELFLRGARCFNLSPSRIMHIGDEADHDLYGAGQAGLQPVLLDREGNQGHLTANRIKSLKEFPELFQKLFR
jgi:FMN phosphatase YigB (HAD superfamily)